MGKFLPYSNASEFTVSVTILKEKPNLKNIKFIVYASIASVLYIVSIILACTLDDTRKIWLSCLMAPFGKNYILKFL